MDLEDFAEPEVAIAAAITAALFSKRVRGLLRRGAVYGVTGAILVGKAAQTAARGIEQNVQQLAAAAATTTGASDEADEETTSTKSNAKTATNGASTGQRARSRAAQ